MDYNFLYNSSKFPWKFENFLHPTFELIYAEFNKVGYYYG
jgi:hypothetical protein